LGQAGIDEGIKGTVLSAFYWGYGVSQASQFAGPTKSNCQRS
jgi:hypothetical protein